MKSYKRIGFIDNTRVLLTILVVLVHASVTYGGEGGWYVDEETDSMITGVLLTLFNAVNQSFFMSLFFLIGGYFTSMSLRRKGAKKFAIGRFLRLGIPTLLFFFAIGPLTIFLGDTFFYREDFLFAGSFHVGPMWFAQALLIFSAVYLMVSRFASLRRNAKNIGLPVLIAMLSIMTFAARAIWPMGEGIWGMQLGSFPQYIIMFAIGITAGGTDWENYLRKIKPFRIIGLSLVLILLMPVFMVFGEDPQLGLDVFMGGLYWQAGIYAIWESAMCVIMSLAVLSIMYQRGSDQNIILRKMSRSSYGVYLIHPPVLVFTTIALMGLSLHPLLKFTLAGSIAIAVSYIFSDLLVKIPGLRKIL